LALPMTEETLAGMLKMMGGALLGRCAQRDDG